MEKRGQTVHHTNTAHLNVIVWQNKAGEGRGRGVRDQPVNSIGQPGVGPLERVREVPARVALRPLKVQLDVPGRRAKNILVVLEGGVPSRIVWRRVGAASGKVVQGDVVGPGQGPVRIGIHALHLLLSAAAVDGSPGTLWLAVYTLPRLPYAIRHRDSAPWGGMRTTRRTSSQFPLPSARV